MTILWRHPLAPTPTPQLIMRLSSPRRGALTVEMAMCLPVLLLVLFGSYELGRANLMRHACESAAYEGARVGIIPGTDRDKIAAASQFILRTVGVSDYQLTITPSDLSQSTETIEVVVEIPFEANSLIPVTFLKGASFRGTCLLLREQP